MKTAALRLLPLLALMCLMAMPIAVHAPSNPTFVTYGDNATCGAHCTVTPVDGVFSESSDQWGVWGTSPALVVTAGDLLVFESINFCIFDNSGPGSATRCDTTGVSDGLGNTWTCTSIGNNDLVPGTSVPVVGASVCYSLATHSGTEAASNAFTLTTNCGTCSTADANHQWDAEWLVYEYSNAKTILRGTFADSASAVSSLNAAITTTVSGDAITGFAYTDGANRPLTYGSSQTNQESWAGSSGYAAGDLEGLTAGSNNYQMGVTTTSNNIFEVISAEISNSLPPTPPYPTPGSANSAGILAAAGMLGVLTVGFATVAVKSYEEGNTEDAKKLTAFAVAVGVVTIILVAMGI
jgi:hypothetical protein